MHTELIIIMEKIFARLNKMTKLETGYSYKYTPEKDSEDREAGLRDRDRTCCGCGETSMER